MRQKVLLSVSSLLAAQLSFAADGSSSAQPPAELETQFQAFLDVYTQKIDARDRAYLKTVHPKLPEEMFDFFFDATLNMMRYSREEAGVETSVDCQDYKVCKVVYPQPGGSWAAQQFILHEGEWRWLDQ